jgi:hypothetical protein
LPTLRDVCFIQLAESKRRLEVVARGHVFGEREITIETEGVGEPHLQGGGIEDVEVFRLVEIACLCLIQGVFFEIRQFSMKRTIGSVRLFVGVLHHVVGERPIGRFFRINRHQSGGVVDRECTRFVVGELEEEGQTIALRTNHHPVVGGVA